MGEWGAALMAALAAVGGGAVTGWFTRSAGRRQADAARHAGDRQADALIATVRATLDDGRAARAAALRRQTYVEFLAAAGAAVLALRTGAAGTDRASLQRALGAVLLEGPEEVAAAARELAARIEAGAPLDAVEGARAALLTEARRALREQEAPGEPGDSGQPG
ncbi:hypothetical protein NX801_17820 [Streptomyces sp. LP05-1]|uniref:Protein kilB n=1 Tax=Streptomyces pyxinae TaxID=2970734 RepID=A0ABT2CLP8_9ACTN|nr:hypothetical protein [Streptomyces sp. LP05-1]MCS0637489.1 hypothetical protein [Streptomyces sp. LP05-1]